MFRRTAAAAQYIIIPIRNILFWRRSLAARIPLSIRRTYVLSYNSDVIILWIYVIGFIFFNFFTLDFNYVSDKRWAHADDCYYYYCFDIKAPRTTSHRRFVISGLIRAQFYTLGLLQNKTINILRLGEIVFFDKKKKTSNTSYSASGETHTGYRVHTPGYCWEVTTGDRCSLCTYNMFCHV